MRALVRIIWAIVRQSGISQSLKEGKVRACTLWQQWDLRTGLMLLSYLC